MNEAKVLQQILFNQKEKST